MQQLDRPQHLIARVALDRYRRMSPQLSKTIGRNQTISVNHRRRLPSSVKCLRTGRKRRQTARINNVVFIAQTLPPRRRLTRQAGRRDALLCNFFMANTQFCLRGAFGRLLPPLGISTPPGCKTSLCSRLGSGGAFALPSPRHWYPTTPREHTPTRPPNMWT